MSHATALFSLLTAPARRRDAGSIEVLEQRVAPAAVTTHWVGGSGNWTSAVHWDNGVPNNDDGSGNSYTAIVDVGILNPTITIDSPIHLTSLTNAESIQVAGTGSALIGDPSYDPGTLDNSAGSITVGGTGSFSISQTVAGLTTATLGAVHVNGGTFALGTTLENSAATLSVDAPSGAWLLAGATIHGGTVSATAGSHLSVTTGGAVLDAVTMNADLDLNGGSNAGVLVKNGLTLNGVATLGDYAQLNFADTQSLLGSGSISFSDSYANMLIQSGATPTLTIGSGITIHGGSSQGYGGVIGYHPNYGAGVADGTIINNGKISSDVDGKTVFLLTTTVVNHGTIETKNGGNLRIANLSTNTASLSAAGSGYFVIGGTDWKNTGTISETGADLYFDGTVKTADLGTLTLSGGTIHVRGVLDNTAATLNLTIPWTLETGTIKNGVVQSGNGSKLAVAVSGTHSVLDGVTMNADLDLSGGVGNRAVDLYHGLTLNGTATLGDYAFMTFVDTQTLGGTGAVVFNDSYANALIQSGTAPTLTIASGMTIRGGSAQGYGAHIGYSDAYGGAQDGTIINQGKFSSDYSGGSLYFNKSAVVNHGTIEAKDGGIVGLSNLMTSNGTLRALTGGTLAVGGTHWTNTGTFTETDANIILDGTVTPAGLGTMTLTGGNISIRGTVENTGTTLTLGGTAHWNLRGGRILGGTVQPSNGSKLYATSAHGTLDGVTMNADLDLTGGDYTTQFDIVHGITLNGTATLGTYGFFGFLETQTLGGTGTIVFNDSYANGLLLGGTNPTLTIASGITIHGGSAQGNSARIGTSEFGGVTPSTIINEGKISADVAGTTLFLRSTALVNHGTLEAKNGGTLVMDNLTTNSGTMRALTGSGLAVGGTHWTNTGTFSEDGADLYLDGNYTVAGLGTLTLSGSGNVNLRGLLENTGTTLTLNPAATWKLVGGTILGGMVQSNNGSKLVLTNASGTLDGVTLNTDLDLTGGAYATGANIYHGLTLNGVATFGDHSYFNFYGDQTLGGTGSVSFLNSYNSSLRVVTSGGRLTIAPTMTIHGGSAQGYGARIGYSDNFGGPSDITVVNEGKISADVSGTSISFVAGRFINAGILEGINGGTINAPAKVSTEKKILTKTSAPYSFQDADGTPVTVKWTGAGSVTLVRFFGATDSRGDLFSITTNGSDLTSGLSIATTGAGATTNVETISINGSLKGLTASTTNLLGNVTSTAGVATIILGKAVTGSTIHLGPRAAGDTKTATSLSFDLVSNLQIESATPLLAITAAQWLDPDGTPDVITAPSLGTLTIKAAANRGLAADFEAGFNLTGAGVAPKALTLGKVAVSGKIVASDWVVAGNVGTIAATSTGTDWSTHFTGSLASLITTAKTSGDIHIGTRGTGDTTTSTVFTLDSVEELSIHSGTPIKSLTAVQWLDRAAGVDVLAAPSLRTLTIKGAAARTIAGDFEADLTLSGVGVAAKAATLGAVGVAGKITAGTWNVTGRTTSVKAATFVSDWLAMFTGPVGSLTTTGSASGDITIGARAAGDVTSKTTLSFDTVSELSIHSQTPIASLTTRNWIDRDGTADVLEAPSLGSLTVKGDTNVTRPLAGNFEAGLVLNGTGVAPTGKTLGAVSVKGKIDDATWTVTGAGATIATGSSGAGWAATFTGPIVSVTASTLSGSLKAASIGTVKADSLSQFNLTLTQAVNPMVKALGTLTVKHAIDHSEIRAAGNIGTVTAEQILHSRLFAGVQSNVTGLPQNSGDFAAVATIAKVVVNGTANGSDAGLADSTIAASKITSATITRFLANNGGQPYGLGADSIASLTLRTATSTVTQTNLDDPTSDASGSGDDFYVRLV